MGYSHVKILDGVLTSSSKDRDCRSFVVKGRYERAKTFWCPSPRYLLHGRLLSGTSHQHLHFLYNWSSSQCLISFTFTVTGDESHGTELEPAAPLRFHLPCTSSWNRCSKCHFLALYCTQRLLVVGYANTVWRIKLKIVVAKGRLTWLLLRGHIRKWKSE